MTGGNSEKLGDRNSNKNTKKLGASLKSSDPVSNNNLDRRMQQKHKFLETLDQKIASANILAISMLGEITKRSLRAGSVYL